MKIDDENRYSRQVLLPEIGKQGQKKLSEGSVLIVGCGALGSAIAECLVRAGVGLVRIADRDVVEPSNLHRQFLYNEADAAMRLPKAQAAAQKLQGINSGVRVEGVTTNLTLRNVEALMAQVSMVLDGTDNLETRYVVNDACVKHGKPWIYGGAVATSGLALPIVPGVGPCLRCVFRDPPPPGTLPTCDTAGVLGTVPLLIGAIQATEAIKLLVGDTTGVGWLTQVDLWTGHHARLKAKRRDDCPACGQRRFEFLEGSGVAWVTTLCGRNAVQITPPGEMSIDLSRLKETLDPVGEVYFNGLTLTCKVEDKELIVFPDGRVMLKGTTDEVEAKKLYDRYIGA